MTHLLTSFAICGALVLAGCGGGGEPAPAEGAEHAEGEAHGPAGQVTLTADQISAAGIQLARPTMGGGGAIDLPAIIEGDPEATQVVSAALGGRVVSLTRNLGQPVARGQTLAVIESREAAQLKGEVEASRARLELARSNLAREQRLFDQRVTPEQDLVAARTAAAEARIAFDQARQQVAATGGGGGGLNRLGVLAPISGQVIARPAVLGQTVAADAELYRIADLRRVSVALNLQPADAARVAPGAAVAVAAGGRSAQARVTFVSPALDAETRLVPVIAVMDNAGGRWRVGEPVTASVQVSGSGGGVQVPSTAIQTVDGRTVVFVRTPAGFQATPVAVAGQEGGRVTLRSGLNGREQIATVNSFTLKAEAGKGEADHGD